MMLQGQAGSAPPVVSPASWSGENHCLIGPFSSREVAFCFATYVLNVGDYGVRSGRVFAKRDAWFVEALSYPASQQILRL